MDQKKKVLTFVLIISCICSIILLITVFVLRKSQLFSNNEEEYKNINITVDEAIYYFENLGYTCDKYPDGIPYYFSIPCKKSVQDHKIIIFLYFRSGREKPTELMITIMRGNEYKNVNMDIVKKEFSQFIKLPYQGANPKKAEEWLVEIINSNPNSGEKFSIEIGGVKITFTGLSISFPVLSIGM